MHIAAVHLASADVLVAAEQAPTMPAASTPPVAQQVNAGPLLLATPAVFIVVCDLLLLLPFFNSSPT